jgi:hypothetical protein
MTAGLDPAAGRFGELRFVHVGGHRIAHCVGTIQSASMC